MSGVEILFMTSVLTVLIVWIWFVVLGFRTSRGWGAALIFLFPVSPFLFAYRFERKTRHTIYYLIGSLVFFALIMGYIQFATSVDFFDKFADKIVNAMPKLDSSTEPKVKNLNLPPPAYIPPPLPDTPEVKPELPPTVVETPKPSVASHGYKTIDIGSIGSYIGKKVVVTTSSVQHRGKLTSVDGAQIEIKKEIAGGTTIMPIKKSKITKIEVYL